jgi:hypothetical protein
MTKQLLLFAFAQAKTPIAVEAANELFCETPEPESKIKLV